MNETSAVPSQAPEPVNAWYDRYLPSPQASTQERRPLFDVTDLRGLLFRQRWTIGGTVLLALVAGLIITMLQQPIYQADTTLRVEPRGLYVVEGQDVAPQIYNNEVSSYMATQVGVIESYNLALVVAQNLKLAERPGFIGEEADSGRPNGRSDEQWLEDKTAMAASMLKGGLTADIPYDSRIATISYQSEDPALAAEIANAYAEAYVSSDARRNVDSNEYARTYLQEQIADVRAQLQDAEKAANAYARSNGIVTQKPASEDGEAATTTTAANLTSINETASAARAKRIAAQQRWRAVSSMPAAQLPEVQNNVVVQNLQNTRARLIGERTNLQQRYNDQYPSIVEINAQIAEVERQIENASADIKASIRSDFVIAREQERALTRELRSVTQATLNEQDRQVQFSVLEREAGALRSQLAELLARFNSISTAANVQSGTITRLDPALVPSSPISPNLMRNLLIALVSGLALAGGLAVIRETFDDRLRSLDDVETKVGLPLFGHTPFVDEAKIHEEGSEQHGALMEAYASIQSTLDYAMSRDKNVLQFTSAQPGEGKSTSALILAEMFARLGRKTLLIDGDLRKPSIAKLLGSEPPEAGLVEVLLGHSDFETAVVKGPHENLDVLAVGALPPNPVETLSSDYLANFLAKQRQDYSIILIDSSPVMGIADAPLLAKHVDGTVFILEANKVQFGQAKAAVKRLQGVGANVLGVVLTKYRALTAGQSYDYQYRYYQYEDK